MSQPADYSKTSKEGKEVIQGRLSYGKLAFLCLISMALSAFGPLSIFSPVPLAAAFLLYGKVKVVMAAIGVLALLLGSASAIPVMKDNTFIAVVFSLASFYAFLISQVVVVKQRAPMKGLLRAGGYVLALFSIILMLHHFMGEMSIKGVIEQYVVQTFETIKKSPQYETVVTAGGQQALDLKGLLNNPGIVVEQVLSWSFAAVFVGTFLGLWVTLFMLLRNSLIWRSYQTYPFGLKHLIHYRTPDYFVWPLILGLVFAVGGAYLTPEDKTLEVVGGNLLYCMAVFYFFQGFGILIQLLDHLRFAGFFRTMFIVCSVFLGWQVIVIVGVFDLWINFKKFFEKKNTEGDNQ